MISEKQRANEILYCMIEQDFFDIKLYEKETNKLEELGDFYSHIKLISIHQIIRKMLSDIIKECVSAEKGEEE